MADNVGSKISYFLAGLGIGTLLGVFMLAFWFRRVRGTAAFIGMLVGETAIFSAYLFTKISFLWYNVIGCIVVVAVGLALSTGQNKPQQA